MNVIVEIEGRDALPVWTIPYVASRWPSPDALVARLVEPNRPGETDFPIAFNLDSHGKPSLIPRIWWCETKKQIDELHEKLGYTPEEKDEWRKRSIQKIMQNEAYIWLDEFEAWFKYYKEHCYVIGEETVSNNGDGIDINGERYNKIPIEFNTNMPLPAEHEHA